VCCVLCVVYRGEYGEWQKEAMYWERLKQSVGARTPVNVKLATGRGLVSHNIWGHTGSQRLNN